MATTGKTTGKSTSSPHDPFNKWANDPKGMVSDNLEVEAAFKEQVDLLSKKMSDPGLSMESRRALLASLAEAKKGLKEAKANTLKILSIFKNRGNIGKEAQMKMSDIKELLKANKDPGVTRQAKVTQELLKEVIKGLGNLDEASNDTKKLADSANLLKLLADVKESTKELPDELKEQFADISEVITSAAEATEAASKADREKWGKDFSRAQSVLDKHAKDLVGKAEARKEARNRFGMGIADRMGIGGLNLGNAIRGVKGVNNWRKKRNELAAARKIVNITKTKLGGGDDVGSKLREDESVEKEAELIDVLKDYVKENKLFNRKLLGGLGKGVKASGNLAGGISGQITGGLSKFFAGAGLTSLLGTIASKIPLGAMAGTLMKAAGPAAAVIGAATLGYKAGTAFYNANAETIQDGIEATVNGVKGFFGIKTTQDRQKEQDAALAKLMASKKKPVAKPGQGSAIPLPGKNLTGSSGGGPNTTQSAPSSPPSSPTSSGSKVSNASGSSIQTNGSVDVAGLHPGIKNNLYGMAAEYQELTGKKLPLNSANRSFEKQAELYRTMPKGRAAAPGRSIHNYGMAWDTNSDAGNKLASSGLLAKYGFERPISKEPWHVQGAGVTLAAAKAGLYSADAPNDQGGSNTARSTPAAQSITAAVSPSASNSTGSPASGASGSKGKGSVSAPSQNSVKDIPTFDQSDGMFLAMNLGIA